MNTRQILSSVRIVLTLLALLSVFSSTPATQSAPSYRAPCSPHAASSNWAACGKVTHSQQTRLTKRTVHLGRDPGDVSSLENPGAVEEIRAAVAK